MSKLIIAFLLLILALTLNFYVLSINEGFVSHILGDIDSSGNVHIQGIVHPIQDSINRVPIDMRGNAIHKDSSGNAYVIDSSENVIYTDAVGVPLNNTSVTMANLIKAIIPFFSVNPNVSSQGIAATCPPGSTFRNGCACCVDALSHPSAAICPEGYGLNRRTNMCDIGAAELKGNYWIQGVAPQPTNTSANREKNQVTSSPMLNQGMQYQAVHTAA